MKKKDNELLSVVVVEECFVFPCADGVAIVLFVEDVLWKERNFSESAWGIHNVGWYGESRGEATHEVHDGESLL